MQIHSTIHPASILAHLCRQDPLSSQTGAPLLRQFPFPHWDASSGRKRATMATLVSVDNGNDAFKGAILDAHDPVLKTRRIVTAYAPATLLRAGEGVPTWQVDQGEPFWIGDDALLTGKAESLPIGMTDERLPDARYQQFLFACLVELLREAGYETPAHDRQGEHTLFLSFGVPNEEVTRSGVKDAVQQALRHLLNVAHTIHRTDEQGRVTIWNVRLIELHPYPQTFGSFVTWYYTLDGAAVETDIVKHVTLDIGGGQFHSSTVTIEQQAAGKQRLRMEAALLDEGTIALARALRELLRAQHAGIRLSDAEAQQALVTRLFTLGGRRTRIDEQVNTLLATRSERLLTHVRHLLQEEHTFLMFTGGGSILLERPLHALVSARRGSQSVLFVPRELSSVLNAIGGYILAQVIAQKRLQSALVALEGER